MRSTLGASVLTLPVLVEGFHNGDSIRQGADTRRGS